MEKITPQLYQKVKKNYPDYISAVENLGEVSKELGPINEKTAQLIQLAAAVAIRSQGAVHSHTKRAIYAGADAKEIHQSIMLLTSTIGFPNVMAALSWADDIIESTPPKVD